MALFSSFECESLTLRKHRQGAYERRVGTPTAGHGNALSQAKRGQGKPRHARRRQVKPKSAKGGQDSPPKAWPGRPGEARESPEGHAGEALKAKAFLARPFWPTGESGANRRSGRGEGEGFTPPLRMGLRWETHPGLYLSCDLVFGCPRWSAGTPMVAMRWPRGCQGMLKGAKGVPKRAQYDPKEGQREPKGTPKTAQREARGGLGRPSGGLGAAWGNQPENGGGVSGFPAQKRTGFWRPRGRFFDNFRVEFS